MPDKVLVMHFVSGLISGGVEQMLFNYCSHIKKDEFEFIVVYQHSPVKLCIDKIESAGCKTVKITSRKENPLKNLYESYQLIKKYRPDIIHSHMNLMNFFPIIAGALCGIKVRISHSHIAEKNKDCCYKFFACICKILISICANYYFACGYEAGTYLYGEKRMSGGDVVIINNAISLDEFTTNLSDRALTRGNLGISDNYINPFIFHTHKNMIRLFRPPVTHKVKSSVKGAVVHPI
jgi:hypothetical protein